MLVQATPILATPAAPAAKAVAAPAAPGTITLQVRSARAWVPASLALHQAIPTYRWIIVRDDAGQTDRNYGTTGLGSGAYDCTAQTLPGSHDPNYPENCQWPSLHATPGGTAGEVVTQGDQAILNGSTGISLAAGKYMVTVLADGFDPNPSDPTCTPTHTPDCPHVDGFKIDGQWFTVNGGSQVVTVDLQPYPLPLLSVRMMVCDDHNASGTCDEGEPPLVGWEGHISDVLGPVTTDWYGNPLCTVYQHDVNGNIVFNVDGRPTIQTVGGHCLSDADGIIKIPYLGPNRYSATVPPPNDQWIQDTSLEGGLDWDIWAQEGWNGNEAEFVIGSEPFPFAEFGFVKKAAMPGHPDVPVNGDLNATGSITGKAIGIRPFSPTAGGVPFGVEAGNTISGPMARAEVSLVDLSGCPEGTVGCVADSVVWHGRAAADGTFTINHVPDGTYIVSIVDQPENFLVESTETLVSNGEHRDMGVLDMFPWFGQVRGRVCNDTNRNGKCEDTEPGIPGMPVDLLSRDNSLQDQGSAESITDANGNYDLKQAYPLGQWVVSQVYDERFYTVGVTYQTNNQPSPTTVMANGGFVDVSTFNLVGQVTTMDWALHRYETDPALGPTNGGIVGTVWYAATRNETDARFQNNEPYEAGIPGLPVHLFAPVPCDPAGGNSLCVATTTPNGTSSYLTTSDGSYAHGPELTAPYVSEQWKRPVDCTALDAAGAPVPQQLLPPASGDGSGLPGGHDCLEGFVMSNQVGDNSVADAHGNTGNGQLVNGNYGFTAGCFMTDGNGNVVVDANGNPEPGTANLTTGDCTSGTQVALPPWDYIVEVEIPNDSFGKPLFKPVQEEHINVFTGDVFVAPGETPVNPPTPVQPASANPQPVPLVPPFLCTGSLHTVDVGGSGTDNYPPQTTPSGAVVPASTPIDNPGFAGVGGSPYEGLPMPGCDSRLITVQTGKSATPNFHFFTDVPLPGRIHGLITDDLNTSTNPKELFYGEKAGIPNVPIGIYDFANRLVTTIHTDANGVYEVILPSTSSYNCPLPAGPCPGVYRLVANDPGQPGHLNADHNPQYRTLSVFQQVWPNLTLPSDLAPIPVSYFVESPGTQNAHPPQCLVNDPTTTAPKTPELFSVSPNPYVDSTGSSTARTFNINGQYFGTGTGTVTLDGIPLAINSWSNTRINARVPNSGSNAVPPGPHQLQINATNGQHSGNALTIHVLGGSYTPTIYRVGPGLTGANTFDPNAPIHNTDGYEHALQDALTAAAGSTSNKLVVVYPGQQGLYNPFGAYYENIIVTSPVKLQGVGPGGIYGVTDSAVAGHVVGAHEPGTVLDGTGWGLDNNKTSGWLGLIGPQDATGPVNFLNPPAPPILVPAGEVVAFLARADRPYGSSYKAAIDGMTIRGGDSLDTPPNLNDNGGGSELSLFAPPNPIGQFELAQGGGIFTYAYTENLQITNNVLTNNGGAYGGAIRLGTPYSGDNHLDNIRIANNRVFANGGTNLAGAIGIFAGTDGYDVANNDICGNFSAEYGGGISHFGLSLFGKIHDNRIYFNSSYDEGAGVTIAGELRLPPNTEDGLNRLSDPTSPLPEPPPGLSPGSGPVDLYNNVIQSNLSGDDGGGIRTLMAGDFAINIYNNIIANNISAHEGGGVALDDSPRVRFFNNTVVKNITTATAVTSTGAPAAAGLSTMPNFTLLQSTLPAGSPTFSNPLMFNNIFCDNRAGQWDGANITGIGYVNVAGQTDPNPINYWDFGVDGPFVLQPTNSIIQPQPTTNPGLDPAYRPTANGNKACPANLASLFKSLYETSILAFPWRGDAHFVGNVIIAQDVPATIMGNYHLANGSTIANNAGAASKALPSWQQPPATRPAPAFDIDNQPRPSSGGFEIGADETAAGASSANLSTVLTDGVTSVAPGASVSYSIVVSNAGPDSVSGASVTDTFPAILSGVTWTCTASNGACGAASGSGNIATTVDLGVGGSATFTVTATLASNLNGGTLANTVTVAAPAGTTDPVATNNSATDSDLIATPLPSLGVLDNFNRSNANTLGSNWKQPVSSSSAGIRVNGNRAYCTGSLCSSTASAYWNVPSGGFGNRQGAAFEFGNTPVTGTALILKASGGSTTARQNFIRVRYQSGQVVIATTTNSGSSYTTRATLTGAFASGDVLSATAYADGTVNVYKTSGSTTTELGSVVIPTSGSGSWSLGSSGGRIGIQMPTGARVDNFAGGTLP